MDLSLTQIRAQAFNDFGGEDRIPVFMRQTTLTILVFVSIVSQACGDGKMYWREEVPPAIPYQRALILFDDNSETLVLQSRYRVSGGQTRPELGWVVPVPATPEVASMPAHKASELFWDLSMQTAPRVTRVGPIVHAVFFCIVVAIWLPALLLWLLSLCPFRPEWLKEKRNQMVCLAIICLLGAVLLGYVLQAPSMVLAENAGDVSVIAEHRVGIYDVRVVRSDSAADLISWLDASEFRFGEKDRTAIASYISQDWCFVTAKIRPETDLSKVDAMSGRRGERLAAPLILRFATDRPVYPLALTGTGDFDTEVLIYLVSDAKMTCDNRTPLRFAGDMRHRIIQGLVSEVEPQGFFDAEKIDLPFLCKFKHTLSPEEMNTDLIFRPATDNTPYRQHKVQW